MINIIYFSLFLLKYALNFVSLKNLSKNNSYLLKLGFSRMHPVFYFRLGVCMRLKISVIKDPKQQAEYFQFYGCLLSHARSFTYSIFDSSYSINIMIISYISHQTSNTAIITRLHMFVKISHTFNFWVFGCIVSVVIVIIVI